MTPEIDVLGWVLRGLVEIIPAFHDTKGLCGIVTPDLQHILKNPSS
jgi:hypothetical protein